MGRTQRSTRHGEHRLPWQERHTIRVEADRLLDQNDDLRNQVRAQFRAI